MREARLFTSVLCGLVLAGAVTGCSRSNAQGASADRHSNQIAQTPQQTCISRATIEGVKSGIADHVSNPYFAPEAKAEYVDETNVTFDAAVLDDVNPATKRIVCRASVTFTPPPSTGSYGPVTRQGQYAVQPSADGKELVYTVYPPLTGIADMLQLSLFEKWRASPEGKRVTAQNEAAEQARQAQQQASFRAIQERQMAEFLAQQRRQRDESVTPAPTDVGAAPDQANADNAASTVGPSAPVAGPQG